MVVGDGSKFNDAYFEISYIRAYTTGGQTATVTPPHFPIAGALMTTTITAQSITTVATYVSPTPYFSEVTTTAAPVASDAGAPGNSAKQNGVTTLILFAGWTFSVFLSYLFAFLS